jgi:hypothetical protein
MNVTTQTVVNLVDYTGLTSVDVVENFKNKMNMAAEFGNFTRTLRLKALSNNATELSKSGSEKVVTDLDYTAGSPSSEPTSNPSTPTSSDPASANSKNAAISNGGIAGIVIGGTVGVLLMLALLYYLAFVYVSHNHEEDGKKGFNLLDNEVQPLEAEVNDYENDPPSPSAIEKDEASIRDVTVEGLKHSETV